MSKTKIPRLFRKKYKSKAFEKKILKRIHIPKEREKIASIFEKNEKDRFVLIQDIPEEILKKLKPLAKTIKKNKGFITTWKAVIVLIIAGSILVFNLVFKDKLIKRTVESGLESVFNSQVDLEKPHLGILDGMFIYQSLTIADKDKPMYNLIETGPAEFKISMWELAFKRVRIDEISLSGVRWNSLRDKSGALDVDEQQEESAEQGGSDFTDILSLNPDEFDYMSLLESQKDNLQSIKLINDSNEQIANVRERWSGILDEKENEIKSFAGRIGTVKDIDITSVGSFEDAQSMADQVRAYYPEVENFKNSVKDLNDDFNAERDQILALADSIKSTIDSDLAYLGDTLDFSAGDIMSLGSDMAETYIRNRWNTYYEYGLKAWNIYGRFQDREKGEKKEKKGLKRASGRNILFSTPDKPSFLISHAGLSGGDDKVGHLAMTISSITSEPDKVSEPTVLDLQLSGESRDIYIDGFLDMRSDSDTVLEMNITVPDNPLEIEKGIPALSIRNMNTIADINGKTTAEKGSSSVLTELVVKLSDITIEQESNSGFLAETIRDIFSRSESIQLIGEILINQNGIESVSMKTDFDKLINDSVGEFLADLQERITGELRDNLLSFINPMLENNEFLASSLDALGLQSLDQISSVNQLEELLDSKIGELENEAERVVAELKARAEAEAEKLRAEAEAEAARVQAEAEAEAARVQAEAEAAAASAVDKAKDKIKLPGF